MEALNRKQKRILRNIGYYTDQSGIMDRYLRDPDSWIGHLKNSKQFIIDFASSKPAGKIAVFGSGWLLDLPVEELLDMGHRLLLVDIVHPKQILHKYHNEERVEFLEMELTGFAIGLYKILKDNRGTLPADWLEKLSAEAGSDKEVNLPVADMYISLNILDQLDGLLIEYIQSQCKPAEADITALRKAIQQSHINSLPPGRSCIIADKEEINIADGDIRQERSLIFARLPDAKREKSWTWHYDDHGDYRQGQRTWYNVTALEL